MSMPDTWEYPWFAAWDMAFHCIALVHVDPAFAKYQLSLLCREWFQNPNGALPAYEWDFSDVKPPVQAWAALEVFAINGGRDFDFLSRISDKLLVNFTWWVNREDTNGSNLFEGFMGLDNIGPLDRSHPPVRGLLEQSDATGWVGGLRVDGHDRCDPARDNTADDHGLTTLLGHRDGRRLLTVCPRAHLGRERGDFDPFSCFFDVVGQD